MASWVCHVLLMTDPRQQNEGRFWVKTVNESGVLGWTFNGENAVLKAIKWGEKQSFLVKIPYRRNYASGCVFVEIKKGMKT
jgi:hypothetical protein